MYLDPDDNYDRAPDSFGPDPSVVLSDEYAETIACEQLWKDSRKAERRLHGNADR